MGVKHFVLGVNKLSLMGVNELTLEGVKHCVLDVTKGSIHQQSFVLRIAHNYHFYFLFNSYFNFLLLLIWLEV